MLFGLVLLLLLLLLLLPLLLLLLSLLLQVLLLSLLLLVLLLSLLLLLLLLRPCSGPVVLELEVRLFFGARSISSSISGTRLLLSLSLELLGLSRTCEKYWRFWSLSSLRYFMTENFGLPSQWSVPFACRPAVNVIAKSAVCVSNGLSFMANRVSFDSRWCSL
jgi:hypothetical protein